MEFIDAPKISDTEGIKKLGLNFKDVIFALFCNFFDPHFQNNFFLQF